MFQLLPFRISHRKNPFLKCLEYIFFQLRNSPECLSYYETLITLEGIVITRWFEKPITIPWSDIECLDLSGLKAHDYPCLNEASSFARFLLRTRKKTRFFLLMSSHRELLRGCRSAGSKTWLAASNVLGVTEIEPHSSEILFSILSELCREHNIRLDGIVLDGL
jgi:hypothetical protein